MNEPFQTRSEELGIIDFNTLEEAMEFAEQNQCVWKISFDAPDGSRVRLIRDGDEWLFQPIT